MCAVFYQIQFCIRWTVEQSLYTFSMLDAMAIRQRYCQEQPVFICLLIAAMPKCHWHDRLES